MMGPKQEAQPALFYEFSLEDHVPQDHLLRSIDRFVDLSDIRQYLAESYSHTGRPSIDPELLIRMLLVGYCFGRVAAYVHCLRKLGFEIETEMEPHGGAYRGRHARYRLLCGTEDMAAPSMKSVTVNTRLT